MVSLRGVPQILRHARLTSVASILLACGHLVATTQDVPRVVDGPEQAGPFRPGGPPLTGKSVADGGWPNIRVEDPYTRDAARRDDAVGQRQHRVEADLAVAPHAGVGREPGGVLVQAGLHHARAELVAQIDREMGKAQAVRERHGHRARRRPSSTSAPRRSPDRATAPA